ncbi:MAG: SDR family NAD(P)-dependent oxidoreductase [Elusimicrobia bacterium]|nr:SDR family NAD(P)-dependent oxidoreductase [Elusimicrobiota bacterium]
MKINDKVALVTGASSGIGLALSEKLLEKGARVAIGSRSIDHLEQIASQWLRKRPDWSGRIAPVMLDVQSDQSCRRALSQINDLWGRLDLLVNNAGHGVYGPFLAVPLEEAKILFDTHYFGSLRLVLGSVDLMRLSGGGMIVAVSSIAALRGVPWMSHYSAAKAAINALSDSMRVELAPYGIRVLNVMPGTTQTEFGSRARYFGGLQLPSIGFGGHSAEEVARCIVQAIEEDRREVIVGISNWSVSWLRRILAPVIEPYLSRLAAPWDKKIPLDL